MPESQKYNDTWVRWIHFRWEKKGEWTTGIQTSILNDKSIKKALFILDDYTCVFVPMDELGQAISHKKIGKGDNITFRINPRGMKIDDAYIKDMGVIVSHTKRKKERKAVMDLLKSI